MRGCIFCEDFRSAADVAKNGGLVGGGTPTFGPGYVTFDGASYLTYPVANTSLRGTKPCTVLVGLRPTSLTGASQAAVLFGTGAAAQGVILGVDSTNVLYARLWGTASFLSTVTPDLVSDYAIAFTYAGGAAGAMRFYVNGVQAATSNQTASWTGPDAMVGATVGPANAYTGLVRYIRAFDQELSPEEVADYAFNRNYAYRSKASIYLPMTNSCHTATATLDTSGNGRNAVFGAGAAAPTKLVGRHGYDFNLANAQYMTSTLNGALNTSEITVAAEFEADYAYNAGANSFIWDASNLARCYCYKDAAGNIRFAAGNTGIFGWAAATTAIHWRQGGTMTVVASLKSGKNNAWFNGNRLLVNDATAWPVTNPAVLSIGSSYDTFNNHDGRITRFASYPQALTSLQVYDLLAQWQARASEV